MPKIIGSTPFDRSENNVLKAFKQQLPDNWIVLSGVGWSLERNGITRDGQADFVVLVPNSGLVVVEVKGSRKIMVDNDGIWHRSEKGAWIALSESPPEQATRNMHVLVEVLKQEYQWRDFPGRYGYLVVYPQGETQDLGMFDESTVATQRHMNQLASRLRNVLDKRGPEKIGQQYTPAIMQKCVDKLKNLKFYVIKVDTSDDVREDKSKIEQLTQQQFSTLRGLFELPRVAVIGPAGSGKTLLAMWRLKALIEEERRAIYVCFNKKLASALQLLNPEYAEFIWSIDKLFRKMCPEAVVPADVRRLSDFFGNYLPGLVIDKAISLDKYDAIIIDEGQDFTEYQLMALEDLLRDDGVWSLFADWRQNLYRSEDMGMPHGAEVVFKLHHNCRNTVKINDAANHYAKKAIPSMPGMPDGVPPILELVRNQADRAWLLAKQWSGEGSVAILSPYSLELSAMKGQKSGHGLRLSEDIKDLGTKDMVYFSTIRSFKGIEASVVIVVDLDIPGTKEVFGEEDLYVATTRATTRLAMLSSRSEVIDFFESA